MNTFDVVVIGSGPGGYVSAIRCAQLGFKTAIVEKYPTLGGTCLNVGCIPSKALLDSSEHFYNATKHFSNHGINIQNIDVDFTKMIQRKEEVVNTTSKGINYLMDKNKITLFNGVATFLSKSEIQITSDNVKQIITTKNTIIATGSKPTNLPFAKIDKQRIITSTEALKLKEIPKHLVVIGGGVIGLELGSVYLRLGSKVTVVEYLDRIIPTMDSTLSKELLRILKKQGMEFMLSHQVKNVQSNGQNITIDMLNSKQDQIQLNADYALVAVGRTPYTKELGLENIGIDLDEKARIKVDKNLETNIAGIYAIGDVINGAMLAHKAEEEGVFVAEVLANQRPHINYDLIPGVVYTWPEVASVGKTEDQLKQENKEYKIGSFPMRALGRARASTDIDGLVKVLADKNTDEILGVHIIGARAADLISEAVVAMEYRASAEDIARICHAHPTYSEALKEAALDATEKRAIHI